MRLSSGTMFSLGQYHAIQGREFNPPEGSTLKQAYDYGQGYLSVAKNEQAQRMIDNIYQMQDDEREIGTEQWQMI